MRILTLLLLLFSFSVQASDKIYVIKIKTSINPGSGTFIIDSIKKANNDGAKLLVIELDTPGGLLETTRMIVQEMLSSKVPIAVNITPPGARAGSAGVMITLAAHVAGMAPSTNIGAAHPVGISPTGIGGEKEEKKGETDVMMNKIVNDTSAFVEGIAKARGRNVRWAIDSVKKSVSITADEALKNHVIDFIVQDTNELIQKADGMNVKAIDGKTQKLSLKDAVVEVLQPTFKLKLLGFIADPNLAYLLMMLAALGIYLELSHPGLILPGVVGGICGILAMMSFQMLPITAAGVVLVIIGFILIGLEFFVTAHGVLGGGGTVALILGGIFLVDPSKTDISVSYSMLFSVGLVFGAIVVAIAYFILKVRRRPAQTGYEGMLGLKAKVVAYDKKKSEGRLMIRGELWHFVTNEKNQDIKMDDMVVIRKLDGMTMIVDKE
jgi:membrane-bound serine protease (ClpP class)